LESYIFLYFSIFLFFSFYLIFFFIFYLSPYPQPISQLLHKYFTQIFRNYPYRYPYHQNSGKPIHTGTSTFHLWYINIYIYALTRQIGILLYIAFFFPQSPYTLPPPVLSTPPTVSPPPPHPPLLAFSFCCPCRANPPVNHAYNRRLV